MKDQSSVKKNSKANRHKPLMTQITTDEQVVSKPWKVPKDRKRQETEEFMDAKTSRKIIATAREQQAEVMREMQGDAEKMPKSSLLTSGLTGENGDDYSDTEANEDYDDDDKFANDYDVHEDDEWALKQFMSKEPTKRFTLADAIMGKIRERETEIQTVMSERTVGQLTTMDPKVEEVYKTVGVLLSRYRSGKLPKAFKIIPSLQNWEEILFMTDPDNWTAASMYQATRMFISNLNPKAAQRFFNLVLLPRCRDDIEEYKRLNVHLYNALKKALFKPQVFFKGILLPLAETGDCTLREAVIFGSVLSKTSVPMLHSAAALLKLAEMEYTGSTSIFIRVLLDKKYALPYRVVDAMVFHFVRAQNDNRMYPVLWHQSFLAFVQRYKEDISSEQKDALMQVIKKHPHPEMTEDIRRELVNSKSRDSAIPLSEMEMMER
ncbi:hypothetical protein SARC_06981 [Sphaeroforma arctica JP610]|uniref:Bystin n=1 Tax=Sphaeroforma arctica JP610 TaxID=667725 RepID=A0A0L0FV14_9EUKA|nr:hypothetical protein SARC_06981 [Sphaeroforma arctica JP610]KNC80667.1 hypothetical protein SARC_06981 [Sphaeroforma arctica JP610]|eukprot:XP_014154569.1 hypothetical protein SARC_06981 [Sphaeroforma arctica JP610]